MREKFIQRKIKAKLTHTCIHVYTDMNCISKWMNVGEWESGFSPFNWEVRGEQGWDGGAIRTTCMEPG